MNFTGNPIAVQLYTLRKDINGDLPGTLEKLAEMGYGAVEFAGLGGNKPEDLRKKMDSLGLKPAGCHLGIADLQEKFEEMKAIYVDTLACPYITVPNGPRKFDDGGHTWKEFCQSMREVTAKGKEAGVTIGYHNHAFEFQNKVDDKPAYDVMFHEKPEESPVAEVDICWVAAGQHDPVNEIRRLNGRVKMLHVKDMDPGMPPKDADVGAGIIQWPAVYKAAETAGVEWLIVERDSPDPNGFESIRRSLAYLKSQGLEK
jgi:sugar phosphate isomerase/epimerase